MFTNGNGAQLPVEAQFVVVRRVVVQIEECREIEIFVNRVRDVGSGDDRAGSTDPAASCAVHRDWQDLNVDLVGHGRPPVYLDGERCRERPGVGVGMREVAVTGVGRAVTE